jgi:hypothetical protein
LGSVKNKADKQASENIIFLPRAKSQIIVISVSGGTPKPQAAGSSPAAPAKFVLENNCLSSLSSR